MSSTIQSHPIRSVPAKRCSLQRDLCTSVRHLTFQEPSGLFVRYSKIKQIPTLFLMDPAFRTPGAALLPTMTTEQS